MLVDPQTGQIKKHFASDFHFAQLISSVDGKELYGVDVKDANWTSVGVVLLDAATGRTLARRDLTSDVWHLTLTAIPAEIVPQGRVEAMMK